jgi:hypothetical protein
MAAQKHQQLVKTFRHRKSLTKFAQKGMICAENEQYFQDFLYYFCTPKRIKG